MKTTKRICINGLGIALFVALTLCIQMPIFQNYYICLGYFVMTAFLYIFGTISGTLVGTLGVILYCIVTGGLRGMPGWALGNLAIGIMMGITFRLVKKLNKTVLEMVISSIVAVISVAFGILVVKSAVEHIIYSLPFMLRVMTNVYAFIADVVIIIISIPVCKVLALKSKLLL